MRAQGLKAFFSRVHSEARAGSAVLAPFTMSLWMCATPNMLAACFVESSCIERSDASHVHQHSTRRAHTRHRSGFAGFAKNKLCDSRRPELNR